MRLPERDWCRCLDPQRPSSALRDLWAEMRELVEVRSRSGLFDEMSDVMFAVGRLAGGLVNRRYVPVPGARAHVKKIVDRLDRYGCVRSERHLADGRCPSSR